MESPPPKKVVGATWPGKTIENIIRNWPRPLRTLNPFYQSPVPDTEYIKLELFAIEQQKRNQLLVTELRVLNFDPLTSKFQSGSIVLPVALAQELYTTQQYVVVLHKANPVESLVAHHIGGYMLPFFFCLSVLMIIQSLPH